MYIHVYRNLNQLKGSAKQDLQIGKTDGFNGQTTPFCSSIMIVTIFSYLPYKKKTNYKRKKRKQDNIQISVQFENCQFSPY